MTTVDRTALIDQYRNGYDQVVRALDGITNEELDTAEADGEWTPRRVVHHLADSEMTSAIRIRKLVAEQDAEIEGYDEEGFASSLYYDDRPIEHSLAAFKAAREVTADLLDQLSDADWGSTGSHTQSGSYSADDWLQIYADHAFEHADQIRRARAGKSG